MEILKLKGNKNRQKFISEFKNKKYHIISLGNIYIVDKKSLEIYELVDSYYSDTTMIYEFYKVEDFLIAHKKDMEDLKIKMEDIKKEIEKEMELEEMEILTKKEIEKEMEDMEKVIDNIYILSEYKEIDINIHDAIMEQVDSQVEIYTGKLFDKSYDLYINGYLEEAITQTGLTDPVQVLMYADSLSISGKIYNNLNDYIKYYVLDILLDNEIEITKTELDSIIDESIEIDNLLDIYNNILEI